jgi:hypothetical protein
MQYTKIYITDSTLPKIYRPSFRENKPKKLAFDEWKRAFWACFRENWVYKIRTLIYSIYRNYLVTQSFYANIDTKMQYIKIYISDRTVENERVLGYFSRKLGL